MNETALALRQGMALTFDEMTRAAKAMALSGYFKDAADVSQAMVKVMAGAEMGLGPFAAMSNIHIIKGKPVLGANMIATLIKNDARYDYRIKRLDDEAAVVVFYEGGREVGESAFTMADARQAGLMSNPTWKNYPRNMLFARDINNGARWYAAGIFGGAAVYTAEEMGVETDEDGYIEGEIVEPVIEPTPEPAEPPTWSPDFIAHLMEKVPYYTGLGDIVLAAEHLKLEPPASKDDARRAFNTLKRYASQQADTAEQASMSLFDEEVSNGAYAEN